MMPVFSRLRLDVSPAFFAALAVWGMGCFCDTAADGDVPWSVESAEQIGMTLAMFWWVRSDSVRRRRPLKMVWGSYLLLLGPVALLVYLFRSRGGWGFVTLAVYALFFLLVGFALVPES